LAIGVAPHDRVYDELKHIRCLIAAGGNRLVSLQNRYGQGFRGFPVGRKPLFTKGAMTVAERVRRHRRRRRERPSQAPILPGDDAAERQAIIREYSVFIEELETILQQLPPGADRGFVLGHRVGIQQAIDLAKRRRA
jgi:hypothetical protein